MAGPEKPKNEGEENLGRIVNFAKENRFDTIAYVAMVIGVLLYIFNTLIGGLIVGGIAGFYFADSIYEQFSRASETLERLGTFRSVVLGGFLLCLAISSTYLLLGVALSAAIMVIVRR